MHLSTHQYRMLNKAITRYRIIRFLFLQMFCYLSNISLHVLLEHRVTDTSFTAVQIQIEQNYQKHTCTICIGVVVSAHI